MRLKVLCAALVLVTACSKSPETPVPTETWSGTPTPSQTVSASPSASPTAGADTMLLIREGTDLTLKGKYKQAVVPLEKALAVTPDDPEIHQQLFLAYSNLDPIPSKKSKAYTHAQRVVELVGGVRSVKAQEYLDGADAITLQSPLPQDGKRPEDVKGFDKATLGMSEDQVQAKLGKLLKPFSGRYENPGNYVPFYIPRYYFGKKTYSVLFPFNRETGKLSGIYIRPFNYPSGTEPEFVDMVNQVAKMYGPPDKNDDIDNDMQQRQRSVWVFPSSEVHVNLYNHNDFSITILPVGEEG